MMSQFIKVTWMISWRLWFVLLFFHGQSIFTCLLLGAIGAAALVFGARVTISTFPLISLLRGRNPLVSLGGGVRSAARTKVSTTTSTPSNVRVIDKPSRAGTITGYEPRFLDAVNGPVTSRFMRGTPGSGLSSAANMSATSATLGQRGEMNFAKALMITSRNGYIDYTSRTGMLADVHTFWSVAMPSATDRAMKDGKLKTDIDAIIVSGKNMILADMKFYTSGDVTYTSNGNQLYCVDNATGALVGKPRTMSHNMEIALERFRRHYPDMNVSAMVIMVPTENGAATLDNVSWTGGIPTVNLTEALRQVSMLGSEVYLDRNVSYALSALVQR